MSLFMLFLAVSVAPVRMQLTVPNTEQGTEHRIVLDSQKDPCVQVFNHQELIWTGIRMHWHPWKITTIDIDENGKQDLLVGLYKETSRMPFFHNTVFVYALRKKEVAPMWLGSSFGMSFSDFCVGQLRVPGELNQKPRLVAAHDRPDGFKSIGVYRWHKFGFQKEWETGKWKKLQLIGIANGEIRIKADSKSLSLRRNK